MDTLKPTIRTRVHEWLADHVSWIQYPSRQQYKKVDEYHPLKTPVPRLMWLLVLIPVPVLFAFPIVLMIYLVCMYCLYVDSLSD